MFIVSAANIIDKSFAAVVVVVVVVVVALTTHSLTALQVCMTVCSRPAASTLFLTTDVWSMRVAGMRPYG